MLHFTHYYSILPLILIHLVIPPTVMNTKNELHNSKIPLIYVSNLTFVTTSRWPCQFLVSGRCFSCKCTNIEKRMEKYCISDYLRFGSANNCTSNVHDFVGKILPTYPVFCYFVLSDKMVVIKYCQSLLYFYAIRGRWTKNNQNRSKPSSSWP